MLLCSKNFKSVRQRNLALSIILKVVSQHHSHYRLYCKFTKDSSLHSVNNWPIDNRRCLHNEEGLLSSTAGEQNYSLDVDFTSIKNAYKSKSLLEILRGGFVYQLCSFSSLVDNSMKLSQIFEKICGEKFFKWIMKMTFYGQFVAGENHPEIKNAMDKLQQYGIGAILDYAVEENLSEEKAKDLEMESCVPHQTSTAAKTEKDNTTRIGKYVANRAFGDRRKKVVSARTYFYEGEEKCDENMNIFLQCIEAAGATTDGGFAAIKLTALGRPQFLLQFSEVLVKSRELFEKYSGKEGELANRTFDLKRFEKKSNKMGILMSRNESAKWFTWMDRDENGLVDLLDWNELIANDRKFSDLFVVTHPENGVTERLMPAFDEAEEQQMKRMLIRIDTLARRALSKKVRLMIDAEQTYFQPAISRMTMEMQRKFNKDRVVIMNTYQCYLKDSRDSLLADLALSKRENFNFGLKLVRGAYMEHERERATELQYEDPIQPTYQDTNINYNNNLRTLLEEMKSNSKIAVMIASHNEETVKFALQTMKRLKFQPHTHDVYFGQLLGMCDHITFPLGQAGHQVYKYVPYGPVREVLPYLHRRAQENRAVLGGRAELERKMLWRELRRRLIRGQLLSPRDTK